MDRLLFLYPDIPVSLPEKIRELVEPTVQQLGYDLVAVEWLGGTHGMLLRLSVEGPKGISAGQCAAVSRAVSPILEAEDPIGGKYTLEVSSPGMKRPVQRPADFERFQGYALKIRLEAGPARRRYSGTLVGFEDGDVLMQVDGERMRFASDAIERAHLVLTMEQYKAISVEQQNFG
jgi:ribosome maturation factor RimP